MAPQVVFEVLSPGNTRKEMAQKRVFYERYGVKNIISTIPTMDTCKAGGGKAGSWWKSPRCAAGSVPAWGNISTWME